MWEANLATGEVFLNARWYEYTGLLAEQCRGPGSLDALHPDDRASSCEHFACASAAGEPCEVELRVRRADGAYHWHLARVVPMRDASGAVARSNSLGLKLVGTLARQLRGALRVGSQDGASFELAFTPAAGDARPRTAA